MDNQKNQHFIQHKGSESNVWIPENDLHPNLETLTGVYNTAIVNRVLCSTYSPVVLFTWRNAIFKSADQRAVTAIQPCRFQNNVALSNVSVFELDRHAAFHSFCWSLQEDKIIARGHWGK